MAVKKSSGTAKSAKKLPAKAETQPAKKTAPAKVVKKAIPTKAVKKAAPAKSAKKTPVKAAKAPAKKPSAKKFLHFEGKDLEHYNALMHCLELVNSQFNYHAADALDCSNADKRGVTTHMADVSSDNSRHEMELRMLSEEGDVLKLINDALKRLIDGEYGKCQDCGEPIPEGRLQVRPYAIYCVKCKSRHESEMSR